MAATAGGDAERLVVMLEARITDFEKRMTKASQTAEGSYSRMRRGSRSATRNMEADMTRATGRINLALARSSAKIGTFAKAGLGGLASAAVPAIGGMLSLAAALNGAKAALADFDKIGKSAKAAGLAAEDFQAFAYAANLGGIETDQFSQALQFFSRNAGLAAAGQGDMYSKLKALNPELLKSIEAATDQADRLRMAADAINAAGTASEKAALATALFGRQGAAMVEVFKGGSQVLDETAQKARDLGIVVSNDVIANAEVMNDRFTTATQILDTQFKSVLIDLAPLLVSTANGLGDMAKAIAIVVDQFKDVSDRVMLNPLQNHLIELENNMAGLRDEIAKTEDFINSQPDWNPLKLVSETRLDGLKKQYEAMMQEALQYQDRIARLQGMGATPPAADTGGGAVASPARLSVGASASNEQAKRIAQVTDALRQQLDALGLTNREQEIASQLAAAHTTAATAEGAAIADLAGKLFDQREALQAANQAAEFFGQTTYDAFKGIIDGSESVQDALLNIAKALAEAVLQASLLGSGPLASIMGTASPTGGMGGLFGSIFSALMPGHASGTANTGGVRGQPAGIVHGQEAVIPLPNSGRVPVQLMGGQTGGGKTSVTITLSEGLEAKILEKAGNQSVQIVQGGIKEYDRHRLPRFAQDFEHARRNRLIR